MEGPRKVVPPQRLEQDFLQKLELVGHPALSAGIFHGGLRGARVGELTHGGHARTLETLVELRRLSDALPCRRRAVVHRRNSHYADIHPDV